MIHKHFKLLNGQGTDKEYTFLVRVQRAIVVAISLAICLTGCGSSLQKLSGTLYFERYGPPEKCAFSAGESGTVTSGDGEILGTINVTSIVSSDLLPQTRNGLRQSGCTVTLEAIDIDLGVNVIQIEIVSQEMGISSRWILNKSDFSDGQIALNAA